MRVWRRWRERPSGNAEPPPPSWQTVEGVNAPAIEAAVDEYMPEGVYEDEDDDVAAAQTAAEDDESFIG